MERLNASRHESERDFSGSADSTAAVVRNTELPGNAGGGAGRRNAAQFEGRFFSPSKLNILSNLPAFLAVAECGQIKLASEQLHIAQSAVSRRISSLEYNLGVALFERRKEGTFLTPFGESFRNHARAILNIADNVTKQARYASAGQLGSLTVGYNDFVVRHPGVSRAIRRFKAISAQIELSLVPMWSLDQVRSLKGGTIDVGMMQRTAEPSDGLRSREMFSQNMLLALPKRHRLAKKPNLFVRDLKDEQFILPKRRQAPLLVDYIFSALHANQVHPRSTSEITSSDTLMSLVSSGMGVGFVNETTSVRPGEVCLRSVVDFNFKVHIDVVHREDNKSSLLRNFLSILHEELTAF